MKDRNAPFSKGDRLRQEMEEEEIKPRSRPYKRCYCGIHGHHHHDKKKKEKRYG